MDSPKRKTMNRYYSVVLIPMLLFLIAAIVILPFALPQEQFLSSGQVYKAIQQIKWGP